MHGQAVLKANETVHFLSKDSTTIGKVGCDFKIDDCTAEGKHAVVEYCTSENRYVLHDLNSVHGTYVNDCRIQNASVRLAHGDIVRFGYNGKSYEFLLESFEDSHCAPQQMWHSPVHMVVSTPRNFAFQESTSLPQINAVVTGKGSGDIQQRQSCMHPHPPLRIRPSSAGNHQNSLGNASKALPKEGWGYGEVSDHNSHEKDQKLLRMADEINRLAIYEQESKRKDVAIAELRHEIAVLQEQLLNDHGQKAELLCQKLKTVDNEISNSRNDINSVKKQVNAVKQKCAGATLTTQLAEREKMIHELRTELDKLKQEYAMSQGLVSSLQREVQSKDSTLLNKNNEVHTLSKKLTQKDVQLSSITAKFARISEDRSKTDHIETLKREIKDLKLKLQASDTRASDQVLLLQSYKQEISKLQSTIQQTQKESASKVKEFESQKLRFNELQRNERIIRVDLEQSKCKLDRFRMRLIQNVYCCPGLRAPNNEYEIDDSSILSDIKKMSEQRTKFEEQTQELKQVIHDNEVKMQVITDANETCKNFIHKMINQLQNNGHHTRILKHEKQVLVTLGIEGTLVWVRDAFVDLLASEFNWLSKLDESLSQAGFDVLLSNENPGEHVSVIYKSLKDEKECSNKMAKSISDLEKKHEEELQFHISQLLQENEEKLAAEIEKMRIEEQSKFNNNLEDLRSREKEKSLDMLKNEKEKVELVNYTLEQLQNVLKEKMEEEILLKKRMEGALNTIQDHENNEKQLRHDIHALEERRKLEVTLLEEKNKNIAANIGRDVQQYKEEIHQHSLTIVSLEKQTQTLMSEKKKLENTISELKEQNLVQKREVRKIPSPPAKSDAPLLQETITLLKSQLLQANHQIHIQQDAIVALQNDLSGAQARISDMTGELSECQKQELEHNRQTVKHQEMEINTIRQQLAKMVRLADTQKQQIHDVQKNLQDSKEENNKYKKLAQIQDKQLPEQLTEKNFQETQTEPLKAEAKLVSDLSMVGATCKGERHENVILRQKEALAELRARIKALEQIRPPLPSQEQALQQVTLLKKELAEIRAKQAMEEGQLAHAHLTMQQDAFDTQQQIRSANTQASIERTTRQNIEEGIICSEKNYMDVVNALAGFLNISSLKGMRSMQHVSQDEQEKLNSDRKIDLELICNRIKSLSQRLDRKEQLLQGYEKDLNKLREAESFASKKSSRVATLTQELMDKSQEIDHLREALIRAKENVETEKRLNKAIKERKTFHLENLDYRKPLPEGCSCNLSKHLFKEHTCAIKKQNKLRRKQYEIDVLKQSVHGKEQDLCQATAELVTMKSPNVDEVSDIYNSQETSCFNP